jgi:microcin C transport system substrate-binding protein
MIKFIVLLFVLCTSFNSYSKTNVSHAIAMHGEPKYNEDFLNVEYIDINSLKGGSIVRSAIGTFDSFNPFTLKGTAAIGIGALYETLTTGSSDEAFTEYGLLAETIEWPDDRSWVSYDIRKEAKWHDGKKITADDVVWTFNTLMEKGHPFYSYYYGDVAEVIKENEQKVRFNFKTNTNKELVLIIGQLPVLPKHYWEDRNFEDTTLEIPIGSGPYKIKSFDSGRSITYELNNEYWGFKNKIPIKVGKDNFGTIRYDYYKDRGIEREAFKSGEIDFFSENSSKEWATSYNINSIKNGLIIKELIQHENPQGMQGFAFNIRKDKFKDRRVRKALSYAFDFEWSNKNLFFDAYIRTDSFFENSELASSGLPSKEELNYLNPYFDVLPKEIFSEEFKNPVTDGSGYMRNQLQEASILLKDAGWDLINGQLKHSSTNEIFEFEILLRSPAFERIVLPFRDNLEKLGINVIVRTIDSAEYQKKIETFDFDMIVQTFSQSLSPGNEQRSFWGSDAADTNGSRNVIGIKNYAVDGLVESLINAKDREELITITRALDRVLLWNYYVIPQWHISSYRVLYWDFFDQPARKPKYSLGFDTWWINQNKYNQIQSNRTSN